jgi:hypothetical protein
MGCDIHMYVEYRKPDSFHRNGSLASNKKYWNGFGNRINPGRDYALFGKLAGVRSDTPSLFSVRGLPNDLGYSAQRDSRLYIVENNSTREDGCATLERANQWVKDRGGKIHYNKEGKPTWVDHPDWHSHSWLSVGEFDAVLIATANITYEHEEIGTSHKHGPCDDYYYALLAAMYDLKSRGNEVRVVFWFDN